MKPSLNPYAGYRYPAEIISHAVWLYHRFTLSFRDIEEMLAERGFRGRACRHFDFGAELRRAAARNLAN